MEGSVVIDRNDLSSSGIDRSEIQGLVFGVHGEANSILVGHSVYHFAHQSIQVSFSSEKIYNFWLVCF